MPKTIVERMREEKRARQTSKEVLAAESAAAAGVTGDDAPATPEVAFIETFLRRFSTEVVPMVTRSLSQEIQRALEPLHDSLRQCVQEALDGAGKAAVDTHEDSRHDDEFTDAINQIVQDASNLASVSEAPEHAVDATDGTEGDEEEGFDGNADTDLEIPINELRSELERIMGDPTALDHSNLAGNDADDLSDEQDTMMLDEEAKEPAEHVRGDQDREEHDGEAADPSGWLATDGVFGGDELEEMDDGLDEIDDLDELDALADLKALEAAAADAGSEAAPAVSETEAEPAVGADVFAAVDVLTESEPESEPEPEPEPEPEMEARVAPETIAAAALEELREQQQVLAGKLEDLELLVSVNFESLAARVDGKLESSVDKILAGIRQERETVLQE